MKVKPLTKNRKAGERSGHENSFLESQLINDALIKNKRKDYYTLYIELAHLR